MNLPFFTGCATAVVTPFCEDGSVHYSEFERILEDQIKGGVSAVVVAGTTGEASTLSDDERARLIFTAKNVCSGRIPVIAGSGTNNTEHSRYLSKLAQNAGADALLVITPYYNKTSQRGITAHFAQVCSAVDLPVIAYDVPGRTGMRILPETVPALAEIPNLVGIKDAAGRVSESEYAMLSCGDSIAFYCGSDELTLPMMAIGMQGAISVLSNLMPGEVSRLCNLCLAGDFVSARVIQRRYHSLIKLLFQDVNPMPVKAAMQLMGYRMGGCRLPLVEVDPLLTKRMKSELQSLGYLS